MLRRTVKVVAALGKGGVRRDRHNRLGLDHTSGGGGGGGGGARASRGERLADIAQVTNAVQTSTASLGIFDKKLTDLGEGKVRGKRKRFDPLVAPNADDEKARYLKVLKRVVHKDSDDAHVDVDKAVKRQRRMDAVTGKKTGEAPKKVRDTARRSGQSRLPQKNAATSAGGGKKNTGGSGNKKNAGGNKKNKGGGGRKK